MTRKYLIIIILLTSLCLQVKAQVPVTAGLKIYMDASDFNAASTPVQWNNKTGYSISPWMNLTSAGSTSPTLASAVWSATNPTGTMSYSYGAVHFSGGAYMENSTLAGSEFNNPNATFFIVGMFSHEAANPVSGPTLMSVATNNTYDNEFGLIGRAAVHNTSSGNFTSKSHGCINPPSPASPPSALDTKPVIFAAAYDADFNNILYQVNGVTSTESINTTGSPTAYTPGNRTVYLGARMSSGIPQQFYNGYIFEIIGYDRVLTSTEMDQVNNYLKCKYLINYGICNQPNFCETSDCGTQEALTIATNSGIGCSFTATATATISSGSIKGYRFLVQDATTSAIITSYATSTSSNTATFTFGLAPGQNAIVKATVITINSAIDVGQSPCCDYTVEKTIGCTSSNTPVNPDDQ